MRYKCHRERFAWILSKAKNGHYPINFIDTVSSLCGSKVELCETLFI